jgi:hypothetical protein
MNDSIVDRISDMRHDQRGKRYRVHFKTGTTKQKVHGVWRYEKHLRGARDAIADYHMQQALPPSVTWSDEMAMFAQWSKSTDHTDWTINPIIKRVADILWGGHNVDWCATWENRQCERYCSLTPPFTDEQRKLQVGVDSLTVRNWAQFGRGWLNVPFNKTREFIMAIQRQKNFQASVIVPKVRSAKWWPTILEMAVEDPIVLPEWDNTFTNAGGETVGKPPFPCVLFNISTQTKNTDAYRLIRLDRARKAEHIVKPVAWSTICQRVGVTATASTPGLERASKRQRPEGNQ